nr:copia protein [Tanacetum cinerariifolium]
MVYDSAETLVQAEVSRTKLLERMKDPLCKVSSKPINYAKLNSLYDNFVLQKQLSRERVYWLPANEVASYNCNQSKHLKEELTVVRIKNDSLRDQKVSIKKRYQDLYQSNAESNSNVSSGAFVPEKPKVLAPGLYAMTPKCGVKNLNYVNAKNPKVKSVANVKQVWKATGKIFAIVGSKWKPTERKFSLGDTCLLTRFTKPEVVPLEKSGSASTSEPSNNVILTRKFFKKPLTSYKRKDRKLKDISTGSPPNAKTKAVNDPVNVNDLSANQLDPKKIRYPMFQILQHPQFLNAGHTDWYLDSGCSRHISGDRSKLINYVKKFIGQFCDAGLEVAFRKYTCYIRNKDKVDLLKGSRTTNMYSISLKDMMEASPICLLSKASSTKSWLWHRQLNHLNFGTLNELARKELVRGDGPKWLFDINALTKSMNYVLVIVDGSLFDSSSKTASNDEPQPSSDAKRKDDEGGYTQEEGIDYNKVFAPVDRIKAIRLFLSYASFKDFVAYQMDVKSAFLYGKIEEEVYVCQPPGFEDPEFPDRVYKEMCIEFEKMMHKKFQISSMGELTFFLGLQVTQKDDGVFISQDKYVDEILKKFGFITVKTASILMETSKPLLKDENAEDVDVHLYRSMIGLMMYLISLRPNIMFADSPFKLEAYIDSDYAGVGLDRKSTTGGCQFLGSRLISWQCNKQTVVANSTTEAKDSNEKNLIQMIKIHTDQNVADLLTKAFDVGRFQYLIARPVVQGEGSTHPVESHHTPTSAPSTSQSPVLPTCWRTTRQEYVVSQPRSPTQSPVADEAASIGVDVRFGGATTTYDTTRIDGFLYNIVKESEKLEKTAKSSQARRRVRIVVSNDEDDLEDPSKQGRKITEIDQDPSILLVQHDAKIHGRYRHDMEFDYDFDTTEKDVSTAEPVSTGAVRLQVKLDEEERQRIARVLESSNSMNVKEWEDIQARVKVDEELVQRLQAEEKEKAKARRNKPPTQAQQRTYMSNYIKNMEGYTLQQLRGYFFDEIKTLFKTTMRRVNTFVSIKSEVDRAVPELAAGSSKRDVEEELDQGGSKRQKTGESLELTEEPRDKEADELSQEEIQQMIIIIYTEGTRKYWKIIKVGNHTELHHFFDDMRKAFDMDDLVMLWSLVKEKFNSIEPTNNKEREIWVELKRLFKQDTDDELWKL